jgi:hypothetical protein
MHFGISPSGIPIFLLATEQDTPCTGYRSSDAKFRVQDPIHFEDCFEAIKLLGKFAITYGTF